MKHLPILLVFLLLSAPAHAQRLAPETTILDAPAVLESTRCGGHFIVEAMINDTVPVRLLVDTGAGITILDSRIGDLLAGDDSPEVTIEGGSGHQVQAQKLVPMDKLQIGPFITLDADALAIDLAPIRAGFNGRVDGILGYPAFKDVLLTLDLPNDQIRVERGTLDEADARTMIVVPGDDRPYIELELVDGELTPVLIDSGSNGVLDVPIGLPVSTTQDPVPSGATITIGGVDISESARLDGEYTFHGIRFDEPTISYSAGEAKLGVEVMKYYAVTFDQRSSLVGFVPADDGPEVVRTEGVRSPGFAIAPIDGEIRVIKIFAGLHAEGLIEEGDVILSANGIDASQFGCDNWSKAGEGKDEADLRIRRGDQELVVTVKIVELVP